MATDFRDQTDAYFCLSCFRRPLVLDDALSFALLDRGDALPFACPFLDPLVSDSFRWYSIQVPAIEKPRMVNHSPTISLSNLTASSSLSMSTDSKVQWN